MATEGGRKALVLPTTFVLLWTSGYLVGTIGTRNAPPLTLTVWRFAVAAVVLTAIAVATRAPWPRGWRAWGHLAVTGALLQGMQFVGVYLGLSLGVSAGLSALVTSVSPLVVAIAAIPLFGERLSGLAWAGSGLGVAGVVLAAGSRLDGGTSATGLALTLLGLAGFAAGTLYQKRYGVAMDLRTGGAVQLGVAGVLVAPVAAMHGGLALPLTTGAVGSVAWLALANSIGGFSLLFVLLRRRRGGAATSLLYLVPPVTAVVAVPMLHQPLQPMTIAGLLLTGAGVVIVHRAESARSAPIDQDASDPSRRAALAGSARTGQ